MHHSADGLEMQPCGRHLTTRYSSRRILPGYKTFS